MGTGHSSGYYMAPVMMDSVIDTSGEDRFEHGPSEFLAEPYPVEKMRVQLVAHMQNREIVRISFGPGTKKFFFSLFPPPSLPLAIPTIKLSQNGSPWKTDWIAFSRGGTLFNSKRLVCLLWSCVFHTDARPALENRVARLTKNSHLPGMDFDHPPILAPERSPSRLFNARFGRLL